MGSVMFGESGEPPPMELVRLAIPRRVYTQSHMDYVVEVAEAVFESRQALVGLRMTNNPPYLRHFTARFEELPSHEPGSASVLDEALTGHP